MSAFADIYPEFKDQEVLFQPHLSPVSQPWHADVETAQRSLVLATFFANTYPGRPVEESTLPILESTRHVELCYFYGSETRDDYVGILSDTLYTIAKDREVDNQRRQREREMENDEDDEGCFSAEEEDELDFEHDLVEVQKEEVLEFERDFFSHLHENIGL